MDVLVPLVAVTLVALTLPGSIELLLLTLAGVLPARRPPPLRRRGEALRIVAVVPAHDEAEGITSCVQSLLDCEPAGDRFRVLVVADNCTDDTAKRARAAGAEVLERSDPRNRGKGYALQWAFARLLSQGADVMLVVDADTRVETNLLSALRARFGSGAAAVQCPYGVANAEASLRTRLQRVALLAFNALRPRARDRLGLSAGILGNGFALSRETLLAVPYDAHSVVEDLEYHLALVRSGRRVEFAPETGVFAEMPEGGRGAETQRERWEGGRLRMIHEAAPRLLRDVLGGHPRLIEPLLELLLLPLAFHVTLLLLALILPWPAVQAYALFGLTLVAAHVLAAIVIGGGNLRDVAALVAAPFYVAWKLTLARRIARTARRDADWVRTERAPATGDQT